VHWPPGTLGRALPAARFLLALGLSVLALLALSGPAQATPTQANFTEDVVFSGLVNPTDVAFAADGRVFVAEKSGLIKVFDNLSDTSATTVGDLRTEVHNFWDRGLLGMVLDPQFPVRPYVYVLYTHDAAIGGTAPRWGTPGATSDSCPNPPGATADGCVVSGRLSRLELAGNSVVGSEQVLLEDWCQQYPSHSTGALAFGADGALYVTGGDGASFNNTDYGQFGSPRNPCGDPPVPVGGTQSPPSAQGGALRSQDIRTTLDPTGLDGSVLRIDPNTGAGLPDNPLAGSLDSNARRIVATGLRNPFRLALRPGTSQVYVGDVGWNSWEEINRIDSSTDASVDNFGWPCYEGDGRQGGYDGANLTICEDLYGQPTTTRLPHFTYSHSASVIAGDNCATDGSSTAGLAFYPGGDYPAAYDGALFFADFSRKCVWVMFEQNGTPTPSTRQLFARNIAPVGLKAGPGGDLFVVDFNGSIRRYRYQSTNHPPIATAQAGPTSGPVPLPVNFDGRGSSDPDPGDTLSYAWDLDGDGIFDDAFTPQAQWTYNTPGQVTARLKVTDQSGESDTDSIVITPAEGSPQASIDAPAPTVTWAVNDTINFQGSATDPQDGALPASRLSWRLLLKHCTTVDNCHTHPIESWDGVSEGSFSAPDHDYPSHLELELTATDSSGLTDTRTVRLDPRTVDLTFRTQPSGLRLAVGGDEEVTPFARTVIVGSRNSISAPTPQALDASQYRFTTWSDGGAQTHDIVAPSSSSTFTANYEADPTPAGLVAAFGFNEGTGASAADSSPEGNAGSLSGASWSAAGRFGGALSFDGQNDWVTVADDPSLDLTTALTMEAWVRPSGAPNGYRTVVMKERPGGHAYTLYSWTGGPLAEVYSGGYFGASSPPALAAGTWAHLAATVSGGSLRLYLNGNLVKTTALPGPLPATTSPLRIGGNSVWGTEFYAGLIDEVRVYNRALSAAQIQADMNTAIAP
jgi:glucose/arabinose dehydrogenase